MRVLKDFQLATLRRLLFVRFRIARKGMIPKIPNCRVLIYYSFLVSSLFGFARSVSAILMDRRRGCKSKLGSSRLAKDAPHDSAFFLCMHFFFFFFMMQCLQAIYDATTHKVKNQRVSHWFQLFSFYFVSNKYQNCCCNSGVAEYMEREIAEEWGVFPLLYFFFSLLKYQLELYKKEGQEQVKKKGTNEL